MAKRQVERVMVLQPMLIEFDSRAREDALRLAQTGGFGCGPEGSYRAKPDGPIVVLGAADAETFRVVNGTLVACPIEPTGYLIDKSDHDALQVRVAILEAENVRLREELAMFEATIRKAEEKARSAYYAAIRDTDEES